MHVRRWSDSFPMVAFAAVVALLATAAGCPGSDPLAAKADGACRAVMDKAPEYAEYALGVAARSGSQAGRDLLLEHAVVDHYKTALAAAHGLADAPGDDAAEALRQVFAAKKGSLKLTASIGLARAGDGEALAWLPEQLDAVGGSALRQLLFALAELQGEEAVNATFREMMSSKDQPTRDEAYTLLADIGTPWAGQLLLEGLGQEHGEGRRAAILALGRSGFTGAAGEVRRFINTRGLVFASIEALGRLGDAESKEKIAGMLDDDEPLVRAYAAAATLRLGGDAAVGAVLAELTGHESPAVRQTLAEQLEGIDDAAARDTLVALASDGLPEVREAAVRSLTEAVEAGGAQVLDALRAATTDKAYTVSTVALHGLARHGTAEDAAALEPLLENRNPYVVISAAQTILALKERA